MDLLQTMYPVQEVTEDVFIIPDNKIEIQEEYDNFKDQKYEDHKSKIKCSDFVNDESISSGSYLMPSDCLLLFQNSAAEISSRNIVPDLENSSNMIPIQLPGVSDSLQHSHIPIHFGAEADQLLSHDEKKEIKVDTSVDQYEITDISDSTSQIKIDRVMTLPVQDFIKMSNPNLLKNSKSNCNSKITSKRFKKSHNLEGLGLLWYQQNLSKDEQNSVSESINIDFKSECTATNGKKIKVQNKWPSIKIRSNMGQSIFTDKFGYYYRQDIIIGNERFLKCVHHGQKCRALGKMGLEEKAPIVHLGPDHSHKPFHITSHKNCMELYEQLKRNCKTDFFHTSSSVNVGVSESKRRSTLIKKAVSIKSTKRTTKGSDLQKCLPKTLTEFVDILQTAIKKQVTLKDTLGKFFNSTITNNAGQIQAVIFVDRKMLARLDNLKTEIKDFVMDTTCRVLPSSTVGLKHLFSLHVIVRNLSLPLLYGVMTSAEKEVYIGILKEFKKLVPDWQVRTVLMDRHRPLLEAAGEVLPEARCYGCWYHYCCSIWRAVMKNGLVEECKKSEQCLLVIRMLMVLPQLPPSNADTKDTLTMYDGVESIKEFVKGHNLSSALNQVIAHVEDFWLEKFGSENFTLHGIPQRAPVFIESFHLSLLAFVKLNDHIWSFMHALLRLSENVYSDLNKLIEGKTTLRKIRSQRFNVLISESYRHLVSGSYTMEMFLKRISISAEDIMDIFLHTLQPVVKDDEENEHLHGWDMAVTEV